MLGVGVMEFGGPEVLEVVELGEVHAGPGEVRLRVRAAAVNPADTYLRAGLQGASTRSGPPPYIPGMDAAGLVDEVGAGSATDLAVGDPAVAMLVPRDRQGAYRQSLVLPAEAVGRAPRGFTHAAASTLPMNGLTAQLSLDELALQPGQSLAVTGAAGCYGGYMVQLAKAAGLTVIADAAPADEDLVRRLGADQIVPRGPDVARHIRDLIPAGVDGLADGSVQGEELVVAVRDGGAFASVRGWKGNSEREIVFHRTFVNRYDRRADLLDRLARQVEVGEVTLRVAETYAAHDAAEAHRRFEAGGVRGRLVIEL